MPELKKDDTPGCTAEACNLRDNFSELPFTLLSDPRQQILEELNK